MIDWAKSRVLVTGGAGFLGTFVTERLRARGAREIIVPRSREYDLVDGASVRRLLATARPTHVIHLAARVNGIGANRENPARFFYDNIMMGTQVLHESYRAGVSKLIAVATVCAYPKLSPLPFREEDLWNGYPEETNAPYGIAKKVLTVQSLAYRDQYGFNSVVLYPTNLYGPGDNTDLQTSHVIPAMLQKFHEAKLRGEGEVVLWGDGSPTREFLYVDDCAEGILLAAEKYESSEPVNLAAGAAEISIADLAATVARVVGFEGQIRWDTSKPNGQPRRRVDGRRARELFGFRATTAFDEGLRRTYAWMVEGSRGLA
jgi:GDP-L-fucose synthase